MKKRITIFAGILLLGLLLSTSCKCSGLKNDSITLEDGAVLTVDEDLLPYFIHPDTVPSLKFDFPNVSVSTASTNSCYMFVNNDIYALSTAVGIHLKRYTEETRIVTNVATQTYDKGKALFGSEKLVLDTYDEDGNEQKYSKEYQLVCTESDGTRYSYQYRTFVSKGVRYYCYCYSDNITMTMEQSLMVIKVGEEYKLALMPLPYDTMYQIKGGKIKLSSLLKEEYTNSDYSTFFYPDYLSDKTDEEKVAMVKQWYEKYCCGLQTSDSFEVTYAGAHFVIDFNQEKLNRSTKKMEKAFSLTFVS
jgi:hypothetical protein